MAPPRPNNSYGIWTPLPAVFPFTEWIIVRWTSLETVFFPRESTALHFVSTVVVEPARDVHVMRCYGHVVVKCRSKCCGSNAVICNKIVSWGVDVFAYERQACRRFFDGHASCLRYEEAVDDWLAKTSIDSIHEAERYGPLLKTRLTGDAMPRCMESFSTMIDL